MVDFKIEVKILFTVLEATSDTAAFILVRKIFKSIWLFYLC